MSDSTKVLIIDYDGRIDCFDPSEAEYWIRRRLEKEAREPARAWIGEPFDFAPIVAKYYDDEAKFDRHQKEKQEQREYERLRLKFEVKP